MFDLLITGGRLIDGTGAPARCADVAVRGERIAAVGALDGAAARTVLPLGPDDILAPGFIDAHSHSDTYVLVEPWAPSKLTQGITTEVCGNCGASAAPILDPSRLPSDWAEKTYPGAWHSVADFRALVDQVRPAVNLVLLAGHNTLRRNVVGYANRPCTAEELRGMRTLLEQALDEGARGFSTGLLYAPGSHAAREELVELARAAGRRGGLYASHMRSEGARLLEAIDETLAIGRAAGCRTQVSHLKTAGRANWGLIDDALDRIRRARDAGEPVAADRYPYTAGATELDVVLPDWASDGGREATLARLRDPALRQRLHDELAASRPPEDWDGVTIGATRHPANARFRGRPLPAAARELGLDTAGAILHFAETDALMTGAFFAGMSEANLRRILLEPWVMVGTDASLRAPEGPLADDYPHPRAYGTMPRFLRLCLDEALLTLPEAIRRLTSLPADQFGLAGRGRVAVGAAADLVVLTPGALRDRAGYGNPHVFSEGIRHVIVNGVHTLADGRRLERAGRFL